MKTTMDSATHTNLRALSLVAFLSNRLAKQLTGQDRALAYQIKASALSALIVADAAEPNGIRPDATVGLDILGDCHCRLHVPVCQLQPEAQAIIRRKAGGVLPVSSFADHLTPAQLANLNTFVQRRAA